MAKDKGEAKAKYKVLKLLWSPSQSRYVRPGETMELGEEIAAILLVKGCVEPARISRKVKKTEVEDDTDN